MDDGLRARRLHLLGCARGARDGAALEWRVMTRDEAVAILGSPEGREETRRVYKLGRVFDLVLQTIYTGDHSRAEAEQLVDGLAGLAEEFFPGSAETFSIIYGRRLGRVIRELYGAD